MLEVSLVPIYTITNTQRIRIYPGKLKFILVKISSDSGQRKPNSVHFSYYWEFIWTPLFTRVKIRSVFRFVQLCCKFTWVNAFTWWYKRVGAYQGNLSTFFCVLIFILIDPNLRIASKRIKIIRTNINNLSGFAIYQSKFAWCKRDLTGDPTYLLIIWRWYNLAVLHDFCLIFSCFYSE